MPAYKYHLSDFKTNSLPPKACLLLKLLLKMLLKRHQTYYFRWQLPKPLRLITSRSEFVRSLRTRDLLTAKKRALRLETKIREIIELTESFHLNELSEEQFNEIVSALWSNLSTPLEEFDDSSALMTRQEHAIWCQKQIEALSEKAKWPISLESTDQNEPRVLFRYALSLRLEKEFNILNVSPEILERLVDEFFHVRIFEIQRMLDSLQAPEFKARIPDHLSVPHAYTTNPNKKMLLTIWNEYANEKKESGSWSIEKTKAGYFTQFSDFLEILGGDIQVSDLNRDHGLRTLTGLRDFPAHRRKRFKDIPLTAIPATAETISANSVNQRLDLLSGFFNWWPPSPHSGHLLLGCLTCHMNTRQRITPVI
jgi:hypothetical protein